MNTSCWFIRSRWAYRLQFEGAGRLTHYSGRNVALGHRQPPPSSRVGYYFVEQAKVLPSRGLDGDPRIWYRRCRRLDWILEDEPTHPCVFMRRHDERRMLTLCQVDPSGGPSPHFSPWHSSCRLNCFSAAVHRVCLVTKICGLVSARAASRARAATRFPGLRET
jgi:hypothetical protein